MRRIFLSLLPLLCFVGIKAQIVDPIKWEASIDMTSSTEGELKIDAFVDEGWHLYGFDLPSGGPISTSINIDMPHGMVAEGAIVASRTPIKRNDPVFGLTLSWWEGNVSFVQRFKIDRNTYHSGVVAVKVRYQGCNDRSCIAPKTVIIEVDSPIINETAQSGAHRLEEGEAPNLEIQDLPKPISLAEETCDSMNAQVIGTEIKSSMGQSDELAWWSPVKFEKEKNGSISTTPWWHIFIWGFGGGLLALLTPCVWPLIPMTVSFFLKKSSSERKAIVDALIYGVSIIVLYLVLGLAITGIFGASKLNDLATNALFNILFFLLLVFFAVSFFGAFNITLPAKWSNSIDSKAEKTTGLISIFFMAFTLALVSFSCTGPIIGTLLVEAASMGNITGPAVGMGGFAIALAIPFTLFAIFPSLLKEMPRSGGWLNSVKVVLGFLELALSLKFLSVADLAYGWGILDRELFLSLWIVLFVLLGLYLLGKLRFPHDEEKRSVSIAGFFLALASLSFSVYLLPGLWGAPLKGVSAFVPPLYTQDFNLYSGGLFEEFDNYDEGMKYAMENYRPVLVDFSGYGCVNCRKMEGAVFDTPEVENIIKENFVLIKLMVDDKTPLIYPMTVDENGKKISLETIGDKWSYLQRMKFGANSQPFYVILDNSGNPMESPYYYDENVTKFVEWLEQGIENYNNE